MHQIGMRSYSRTLQYTTRKRSVSQESFLLDAFTMCVVKERVHKREGEKERELDRQKQLIHVNASNS